MRNLILAAFAALTLTLTLGCTVLTRPLEAVDGDGDGDVDADGDGDGDVDGDVDGDGDSDGDADADADADGDAEETLCVYYRDADADGYGVETESAEYPCGGKVGWSLIAGDCDDDDPEVNPDAEEVCDGIDNDCDGEIDEGFDEDGDGWTTCDGDCDDGNDLIHPGMVELCDDLDNNCDGWIDEGIGFCFLGASSFIEDGDPDVLFDESSSYNHALAHGVGVDETEGSLVFRDGAYAELISPMETSETVDVGEFTVAFWIRVREISENSESIIGRGRSCADPLSWEILRQRSGGQIVFTWSSDGIDENRRLVYPISPDELIHVAISVSLSEARMYINGSLHDSESGNVYPFYDRSVRIGAGWCSQGSPFGSHFNGELRNIYFYSRLLTEAEVLLLYNSYL